MTRASIDMAKPIRRVVAALLGVLATALLAAGPAPAAAPPAWLSEINYWRAATGLAAVVDEPAWDTGIEHHLTYLENTPASYRTGQYASAHTENPASPYYTADGAREGADSDLALGGADTPTSALDEWLAAPFHALGMLRAQLTAVAFADDPQTGYAGLDVIQGLDYGLPAATQPILYPGPGSTTNLFTLGDELPDPSETCGWQHLSVGLPIVIMLPQAPASGLSASLSGPSGVESTANHRLCVVDSNTYHSSDPVYGPTGAELLSSDNAVFLIARSPLAVGAYAVDVVQPGQADIRWSFHAAPATATPVATLSAPGHVRAGHPIRLGVHALGPFRIAVTVRTGAGRRLDRYTGTSHTARWSIVIHLAPGTVHRGTRLIVRVRIAVGSQHISLMRVVRCT